MVRIDRLQHSAVGRSCPQPGNPTPSGSPSSPGSQMHRRGTYYRPVSPETGCCTRTEWDERLETALEFAHTFIRITERSRGPKEAGLLGEGDRIPHMKRPLHRHHAYGHSWEGEEWRKSDFGEQGGVKSPRATVAPPRSWDQAGSTPQHEEGDRGGPDQSITIMLSSSRSSRGRREQSSVSPFLPQRISITKP